MSTRRQLGGVILDGVPFVALPLLWIAITAVFYGATVLLWPEIPAAIRVFSRPARPAQSNRVTVPTASSRGGCGVNER